MSHSEIQVKPFTMRIFVTVFACTLILLSTWASGQAWQPKTDMPTPRKEIANAAVTLDGKIYVVGGVRNNGTISNKLEVYDPQVNDWTTLANYPLSVWRATAAATNGKIYVFGGYQSLNPFPFNPSNTVYEYDPVANDWTQKANMLTSRGASCAVLLNGKIHLIGGASSSALNTQHVYDPVLNSWSTAASMAQTRSGLTANVIMGKIYAMGGYFLGAGVVSQKTAEVYDPALNVWSPIADMPMTKLGISSAVAGGQLYVFGNEGNTNTLVYNPDQNNWSQLGPMPENVNFAGAATVNETIYLIGGGPVNLNRFDGIAAVNCFEPVAVGVEDIRNTIPGFRQGPLFPNPTSGAVTLEFGLSSSQNLLFSVVDLAGRPIWESQPELYHPNNYQLKIGLPVDLAPGFYLLKAQAGTRISAKSFILH